MRKFNVLIVEDDPMVAKINKDYVEKSVTFEVVKTINNGKDALIYLSNNKVDLIILDIYMPTMSGLELLEMIRSNQNNTDVIFVTAAKERKAILRGLQLGVIDYLIKPFTYDRMVEALNKFSSRYELIKSKNDMEQSDVDQLFVSKNVFHPDLPKGIQSITMNIIWTTIVEHGMYIIDMDIIENEIGISVVTLRKYLDYFVDTNKLSKEVKYGSVGRPTYVYKLLDI